MATGIPPELSASVGQRPHDWAQYSRQTTSSRNTISRRLHNTHLKSATSCSDAASLDEQRHDSYMYAGDAGVQHTGELQRLTYAPTYPRHYDDGRSMSTASSGIKRSASPDFLHARHKRRHEDPKLHMTASSQHDKPPPSAWTPTAQGVLQRYPLRRSPESQSFDASRVDSGFAESRQSTMQTQTSWSSVPPVCNLLSEPAPDQNPPKQDYPHFPASPKESTYEMVRQLPRTFITQEQLAAEVKGIYAGLVMVEAKSINIDAEQAADRNRKLSPEQWQALVALRRTLLYEHHDFLMATQHPTANAALRGLAAKYCMPARMWKHGIHGFLEVLRHRRPESQEYMLSFIYLAYDMMALLFETVPAFTDTWIECLGDLARYRMAIEEDKEIHAIWGGVAGRWYMMAADRHPNIGRLYHHLGILERPSLRKLYFYSRSLTSVVPFINARESLGTLCAPLLQDEQLMRCGPHGAEAITICYHARVFSDANADQLERDGVEALRLLKDQAPGKVASYATPLAVTNIASLFEFGLPNNVFRQMFSAELARAAHMARPSTQSSIAMSEAARAITESEAFVMTTQPSDFVVDFMTQCFNNLIRRRLDHATVRDLLQYVHVNLVFFSALLDLRPGLAIESQITMVDRILNAVDWATLAVFLNELVAIDPLSWRVEEAAAKNEFLLPEKAEERKPLAEDFMIRGVIWAEGYVATDLFQGLEDDDGSRVLETPSRLHLRAERVEWLACCIAQPAKQAPIVFDSRSKRFAAQPFVSRSPNTQRSVARARARDELLAMATPRSPGSSATMSRQSSLVDEYDFLSLKPTEGRLDVKSQGTPSEAATYPSKTDDSYVVVSSVRSNTGSQHRPSTAKSRLSTDVNVQIVGQDVASA